MSKPSGVGLLVAADALLGASLEISLPMVSGDRVTVVRAVREADAAVEMLECPGVDVAVVDLGLPGSAGLLEAARATMPVTPTVGLADPAGDAMWALAAGCGAVVGYDTTPDRLLAPIFAVLGGWRLVPSNVVDGLTRRAARPVLPDGLDDRYLRLWGLMIAGNSTDEIAARLGTSPRTTKRLISDLLGKLGVSNRCQLATLGGRYGIPDPPVPENFSPTH